ncbi:MAG: hypothetical protein CML56_05305 [Rhodobacteraceae bacterium]|nr:hypothetical protein [Paracoccaceae bacterium]
MFPFFILWGSFHFYWVHRVLHWPPLYRISHARHDRNVNVGPWSVISMHPVDCLLFSTSFIIHFCSNPPPAHYVPWFHPIHPCSFFKFWI